MKQETERTCLLVAPVRSVHSVRFVLLVRKRENDVLAHLFDRHLSVANDDHPLAAKSHAKSAVHLAQEADESRNGDRHRGRISVFSVFFFQRVVLRERNERRAKRTRTHLRFHARGQTRDGRRVLLLLDHFVLLALVRAVRLELTALRFLLAAGEERSGGESEDSLVAVGHFALRERSVEVAQVEAPSIPRSLLYSSNVIASMQIRFAKNCNRALFGEAYIPIAQYSVQTFIAR